MYIAEKVGKSIIRWNDQLWNFCIVFYNYGDVRCFFLKSIIIWGHNDRSIGHRLSQNALVQILIHALKKHIFLSVKWFRIHFMWFQDARIILQIGWNWVGLENCFWRVRENERTRDHTFWILIYSSHPSFFIDLALVLVL